MKISRISYILLAIGLLFAFGGFINHYYLITTGPNGSVFGEWLEQNYANVSWELISIFITVGIIQATYEKKRHDEQIDRLMRETSSEVRDVAVKAVEDLREEGKLIDGSLHSHSFWRGNLPNGSFYNGELVESNFSYAILNGANFNGAQLRRASFEGVSAKVSHFHRAILENVNMFMADLEGADFLDADLLDANLMQTNLLNCQNVGLRQFVLAKHLHRATMPDGKKYDGRFRLVGDIDLAGLYGIDLENPISMSRFYGVNEDEYLNGQRWANENLETMRTDALEEREQVYEDNGYGPNSVQWDE